MAPKKRRKWLKFTLFIAVLAVAGAGIYYATHKLSKAADKESASYGEVTIGDIESVVTAQGKLEPKEYVDVGAQVSGQVTKLHVDIGDVVKTGDLIAEIDPDVYQSEVAGDEARLKTLQAQKAEQEANVKQAQQKLDRSNTLIQQGAVSKEVQQDADTALQVAQAQLKSLQAQIEEAQSTLEGAKTNLGYTKIYAPMDGTIVSQTTKEGQTINANQTAPVIVQIADLDVMTVRAQVAEADISKLSTDMEVYFTTMGSQSRRWKATIRQILPSPETVNDVVLYDVLVDVDNKEHQLMTGMTTQMFFVLGHAENVPVVPVSALMKRIPASDTTDGKAYQVNVVQGRATTPQTAIIGLSDRTKAQVISGLKAGDKIVLQTPATGSSASSAPAAGGGPRGMRGMARL